MKKSKGIVGVAGLGGLGSSVAIALARMGIGTLILVDFDVIEPSNLNRQQYVLSNLGQLKTEALASIIEKINPNVRVITKTVLLDEDNIFSVFQPVTIAVECLDTSKAKATFINTIIEASLIFIRRRLGYRRIRSKQPDPNPTSKQKAFCRWRFDYSCRTKGGTYGAACRNCSSPSG